MSTSYKHTYYPSLDGLRGFAALLIVLFHFGWEEIGSGFLGVDIFFVISGFVITLKLLKEIEVSGSINFSRFYAARVRRLFPALLATVIITGFFAVLLFSERLLIETFWSMAAALSYVSNFYFFYETNYFSVGAIYQPMLHTWSLSVEEQFYLVWPAMLLFLSKRTLKFKTVALFAFIIISLLLCELIREFYSSSAAFYMLFTRFFELAIGGLIAMIGVRSAQFQSSNDLLFGGAFICLLIALVFIKKASDLPGVLSLSVALPTAVMIWASESRIAKLVFANVVSRFFGRISYSLYLVHWPLFVFWHMLFGGEPTISDTFSLFVISVFLAVGLNQFVEEPFRLGNGKSLSDYRVLSLSLALAAVSVVSAGVVQINEGLPSRIPEERKVQTVREARKAQRAAFCSSNRLSLPEDLVVCQNEQGKESDLFVWGDSHAQHLVAGLHHVLDTHNIFVLRLSGCDPFMGFNNIAFDTISDEKCAERNLRALQFFKNQKPSDILFSWSRFMDNSERDAVGEIETALRYIVPELKRSGHRILIFTDFVRPYVDFTQCLRVPDILISSSRLYERCVPLLSHVNKELAWNERLVGMLSSLGYNFIDVSDYQCPRGKCRYFINNQHLYRDFHHINDLGSIYYLGLIGEEIRDYFPKDRTQALKDQEDGDK